MNTGYVIFGILWLVSLFIFTGLKKIDQELKHDERYIDALNQLHTFADFVVRYAKDLGDENDIDGRDRRQIACKALQEIRDNLGLDITDEQIELLVRANYQVIKGEEQVYVLEGEVVDGE